MKVLVFVVGLLAFAQAAPSTRGPKGPKMLEFEKRLRMFTASMYDAIAKDKQPQENIFFSPGSIAHALGMVLAGARGNTADEIKRALMLDSTEHTYTQNNFNNLYRKVYNRIYNLKKDMQVKAMMASRMFVSQGYPVYQTYKNDLHEYYDSDSVEMDFGNKTEAANEMNEWVKEKTGNLIGDLIKPDDIDDLLRLMLINALYFKGKWQEEMNTEGYEGMNFYANHSRSNPKHMDFMGRKGPMKLRNQNGAVEVAIPYKGDEAYFYILMPHSAEDFKQYSERRNLVPHLSNLNVTAWHHASVIEFSMPLLDLEEETNVKEVLEGHMGVYDLFSPSAANLSGVAEESLYVNVFKHKAKVQVNEKGTEAAAATAVGMAGRSGGGPPIITINMPFLFGIFKDDNLLFFGRYMG